MKILRNIIGICLGITLSLLGVSQVNAQPGADLPGLVSTTKATWTPDVNVGTFQDGQSREVWDFEALTGGVMVACGKFNQVRPQGTTAWSTRQSVFSFYTTGANIGKLTSFAPRVLNGTGMGLVNKCELSYDGASLIIGGQFTSVNGVARSNVAKINLASGAVEPFASTNGKVTDIIKGKGRYWLFGTFTRVNTTAKGGIATVTQTGAFDNYFTSTLRGNISSSAGPTGAYRGAITTDDQYMIAIINASSVDNKPRKHLAVWRLGASNTLLREWQLNKTKTTTCQKYMVGRGLDIVPGTSDAVLSSTGGPAGGVCDQLMRFSLAATGSAIPVKWSNYTCGDTSHAAAATTGWTYSQGHMKCTEFRVGGSRDYVDRYGIFAARTSTGNLPAWRSDQARCVGGKSLYVLNKTGFPQGLFSGLDCETGIVFRPL